MKRLLIPLLAISLTSSVLHAHEAGTEMAAAANNLLAALSPEEKAKTVFEFADAERVNWHFIPRERKGLSIKEMSQEQRLLAQALLATGLSHRGYSKAVSIMSLEAVLASIEKFSKGYMGEVWKPAPLLVKLAKEGRKFNG